MLLSRSSNHKVNACSADAQSPPPVALISSSSLSLNSTHLLEPSVGIVVKLPWSQRMSRRSTSPCTSFFLCVSPVLSSMVFRMPTDLSKVYGMSTDQHHLLSLTSDTHRIRQIDGNQAVFYFEKTLVQLIWKTLKRNLPCLLQLLWMPPGFALTLEA